MKKILFIVAVLLWFVAPSVSAQSYNTSFPATENPISQGGKWVSGSAAGTNCGGFSGQCWNDVQTENGLATNTGDNINCSGNPGSDCNDASATLTGTWGPNQTMCATVTIGSIGRTDVDEVEIHLNSVISSQSITQYEFTYSTQSSPYNGFVRWNGPIGSFTSLGNGSSNPPELVTGDIICATHTQGSPGTLSATYNHGGTVTPLVTVADNIAGGAVYSNGAPGIGFYNQQTLADNGQFGFSAINATATGGSGGNTYTAATCDQVNVNGLINNTGGTQQHQAVDGDTIIIPAGSCTWTSSIIVPPNIGISIIGSGTPNASNVCTTASQVGCGAGTINTIITHGGFIMAPTFGKSLSRISLINFFGSGSAYHRNRNLRCRWMPQSTPR